MIGFQMRRMMTAGIVAAAILGIGEASAFGVELFPADGATGVCVDTPLRVGLDGLPVLSGKGTIVVTDAESKQVVETIDMGAAVHTESVGGVANFNYLPVTVEGKVATIHLKNGALGYGHRYTVMVDGGGVYGRCGGGDVGICDEGEGAGGGGDEIDGGGGWDGRFCDGAGGDRFCADGEQDADDCVYSEGGLHGVGLFCEQGWLVVCG